MWGRIEDINIGLLIKGMLLIYVAIGCIWDIKTKSVPVQYLLAGNLVSAGYLIYQLCEQNVGSAYVGTALLPGAFLIIFAVLGKGALGIGDGLVWTVIGGVLGIWDTIAGLFLGLLVAAFWSGILLIQKKAGRNTRIPFLPCSFLGETLWLILKPYL